MDEIEKKIFKTIYIYIYIFLETKPNFTLTGKCFALINFSNGKQTQKSLESDFHFPPNKRGLNWILVKSLIKTLRVSKRRRFI